jgi:hypothetical protein
MMEPPDRIWITIAGYDPGPQYDPVFHFSEPDHDAKIAYIKAEAVLPFVVIAVTALARNSLLPEGHLSATHYDLLRECGARMDSFTRGGG